MPWLEMSFVCERALAEALSVHLADGDALSVSLSDAEDEPLYEPPPGRTPLWQRTRVSALFEPGHDAAGELERLAGCIAPRALPEARLARVEDADWVRAGQAGFEAMRFGERLWVVPSWCEPPADCEALVRLDPGLAFGTGTHPTTALCLEWLEATVRPGMTVCDYGCGSGVLAVAALALGAAGVTAVDIDPQALAATRSNAAANGVADRVRACAPDEAPGGPFDLVVANILAGPLEELAPHLAALTAPGGSLALSGLLVEQADAVERAYEADFETGRRAAREGWCRLDLRRAAG